RIRGAWTRGTDERRIGGALLGGAGIGAAGLLATAAFGPGAIAGVDTSKDAFLRRNGLGGQLPSLYRSRLASNWLRLLLPAEVPLAAYGAGRAQPADHGERLLRTLLLAWLAVTAGGVVVSIATGLLPGERFLSFAFALPILAAAGVSRLWLRGAATLREESRAGWARPLAVAAVVVVAVGSVWAWWHPAESFRDDDMATAARAAVLVGSLPRGTPLVFVVDDPHHAPLSVPRFGNELRAVLPPDRIRDVHLFVGRPGDYLAGRPTATGDPLHNAMSARYLRDLRAALKGTGRLPVAFVLAPMNERNYDGPVASGDATEVLPGVAVVGPAPALYATRSPADTGGPTSPWLIVVFAAAALAVLWVAGAGWSCAALGRGVAWVAAAPAFGIAALVLIGVAVDRLGIRLTGAVPILISALVAAGGFVAARATGRGGNPGEEVGVIEG
ncbi:MAG TPA: hypothetical protein VNN79_02160, partial [Actinomycetota bacterium]|nr:hypothetical protein [Actinomycetota bacterium]